MYQWKNLFGSTTSLNLDGLLSVAADSDVDGKTETTFDLRSTHSVAHARDQTLQDMMKREEEMRKKEIAVEADSLSKKVDELTNEKLQTSINLTKEIDRLRIMIKSFNNQQANTAIITQLAYSSQKQTRNTSQAATGLIQTANNVNGKHNKQVTIWQTEDEKGADEQHKNLRYKFETLEQAEETLLKLQSDVNSLVRSKLDVVTEFSREIDRLRGVVRVCQHLQRYDIIVHAF